MSRVGKTVYWNLRGRYDTILFRDILNVMARVCWHLCHECSEILQRSWWRWYFTVVCQASSWRFSPSRSPTENVIRENTGATTRPVLSTHVVPCETARHCSVTRRFTKEINDHINRVGFKGKGRLRAGSEDPQGRQRYGSVLSFTSWLDEVGGER